MPTRKISFRRSYLTCISLETSKYVQKSQVRLCDVDVSGRVCRREKFHILKVRNLLYAPEIRVRKYHRKRERETGHGARVNHRSTPFANASRIETSTLTSSHDMSSSTQKAQIKLSFPARSEWDLGQKSDTNFAYRKTIFRHGHFSYAFNILYYSALCAYGCIIHMYNAAKIALLNFITALDGFSHRASSAFLNTLCRFFLSTKRVTGIQLFKE